MGFIAALNKVANLIKIKFSRALLKSAYPTYIHLK